MFAFAGHTNQIHLDYIEKGAHIRHDLLPPVTAVSPPLILGGRLPAHLLFHFAPLHTRNEHIPNRPPMLLVPPERR